METKTCTECGIEKSLTEFSKDKKRKDRLQIWCKDCLKEYQKKYRQENKEKIAAYLQENKKKIVEHKKKYYQINKNKISKKHRLYYQENKDSLAEYRKAYQQENKEKIAEDNKLYQQENKEKIAARKKIYRQENKEKIAEGNILYRQNNKEKLRQYRQENAEKKARYQKVYCKKNPNIYAKAQQKRKAIKKGLPHSLTVAKWETIKQDFDNSCAYCGVTEDKHLGEFNMRLHQEHFIPLSKGGGYTHNNIIPACLGCNTSKGAKSFSEWYPTYEHYNKKREQFILEYLNYVEDSQQLTLAL